jgi:hypothetical protein
MQSNMQVQNQHLLIAEKQTCHQAECDMMKCLKHNACLSLNNEQAPGTIIPGLLF